MWTSLFTADVWTAYLIPGLINTLKAAAISIVLAVAFGLVFGMGRLSHLRAVRWVCGVIVEFFRSVPVLLMMYFTYFYYSNNGVFTNAINPLAAVVTGLTLYNGSVIAEPRPLGSLRAPEGTGRGRPVHRPDRWPDAALDPPAPGPDGHAPGPRRPGSSSSSRTARSAPRCSTRSLLQAAKDIGTAYSNTIPAYIFVAVIFILLNYGLTVLAGRVERRLNRRGRGPRKAAQATGVVGAGTVDAPTVGIAGTGVRTGDANSR